MGAGPLFWATSPVLRLLAAVTVNSLELWLPGGKLRLTALQAQGRCCFSSETASEEPLTALARISQTSWGAFYSLLANLRDSALLSGASVVLVSGGEMFWELG